MRIWLLFILSISLSGCGYVSSAGLDRLDSVSPLEAEPADIAVALALPPGLDVVPGSAQINFSADRSDTREKETAVFTLARNDTGNLNVFTIAPEDHDRLRELQGRIQKWEDEAPDRTSGSIGVTVDFCKKDPGPAPTAKVTVLTRTESDGKFFSLIENAPLSVIQRSGALGDINLC